MGRWFNRFEAKSAPRSRCEQVNDADERIICVSSIDGIWYADDFRAKSPCFASTGASSRAVVTIFPSLFSFSCRRRKSGVSSARVAASSNRFAAKPAPPCASCRRRLSACANEDDELLEIGQWPADACALGIRIVSGRLRGNMRHKAAERMSAKPAAPTSSPSVALSAAAAATATSRAHVHRNDADRVRAHGSNHHSPQRRVRPAFDARGDRSGRHRRQQRAHMTIASRAHRKRVGSRRASTFQSRVGRAAHASNSTPARLIDREVDARKTPSVYSRLADRANKYPRRKTSNPAFIASSGAMLPELAHLAASASATTKNIKDEPIFMIS